MVFEEVEVDVETMEEDAARVEEEDDPCSVPMYSVAPTTIIDTSTTSTCKTFTLIFLILLNLIFWFVSFYHFTFKPFKIILSIAILSFHHMTLIFVFVLLHIIWICILMYSVICSD